VLIVTLPIVTLFIVTLFIVTMLIVTLLTVALMTVSLLRVHLLRVALLGVALLCVTLLVVNLLIVTRSVAFPKVILLIVKYHDRYLASSLINATQLGVVLLNVDAPFEGLRLGNVKANYRRLLGSSCQL